jgi:hypothetical protein
VLFRSVAPFFSSVINVKSKKFDLSVVSGLLKGMKLLPLLFCLPFLFCGCGSGKWSQDLENESVYCDGAEEAEVC